MENDILIKSFKKALKELVEKELVKVIDDNWICDRCHHRMDEHKLRTYECFECDCHLYVLSSEQYHIVQKNKKQYNRRNKWWGRILNKLNV